MTSSHTVVEYVRSIVAVLLSHDAHVAVGVAADRCTDLTRWHLDQLQPELAPITVWANTLRHPLSEVRDLASRTALRALPSCAPERTWLLHPDAERH